MRDIIVGVVLCIAIPVLTYFVIKFGTVGFYSGREFMKNRKERKL